MADYSSGAIGGTQFPLPSALTNSLLRDADPAVYYALDFLASMVSTHVNARLVAQSVAGGVTSIASSVAMAIPMDPAPWLTSEQVKFPLLSICRKQSRYQDLTIAWRRRICEAQISYVLPPIVAGQAEQVMPVLNAVADVLAHRVEQGFDPAYTPPGSTAGASVWQLAGIDRIEITGEKFGGWDLGGELFFPALIATLSITERTAIPLGDFQDFAGADINIDIKDQDGTTVSNVVQLKSEVVPPGDLDP